MPGRDGCLTVVTQMRWHSLEMGQQVRVASRLLASEIPKCGVKLSLSEVRTQQLLGRTFSGPTEGIFRILPPRSGIQVHIQYVTMPESKFYIQTWASWISVTGQIAIEK